MLHEFVDPADIPIILSIRISKTGRRDCFCWDHTKSRLYSVKSGYSVAHDMRRNNTYAPVLEPSSTRLKKSCLEIEGTKEAQALSMASTLKVSSNCREVKIPPLHQR
uniref:Uncharacterized protein n=1 Tax=Brassica oleracea TaxID=3712 RepID=A0A3P6D7N7_BRAOL|nr:unnamed protein product [Brassica oleracea]